jgi:hypothetical protein
MKKSYNLLNIILIAIGGYYVYSRLNNIPLLEKQVIPEPKKIIDHPGPVLHEAFSFVPEPLPAVPIKELEPVRSIHDQIKTPVLTKLRESISDTAKEVHDKLNIDVQNVTQKVIAPKKVFVPIRHPEKSKRFVIK